MRSRIGCAIGLVVVSAGVSCHGGDDDSGHRNTPISQRAAGFDIDLSYACVPENGMTIRLKVRRDLVGRHPLHCCYYVPDISTAVSLDYKTVDGSAKDGVDYEATSGSLTWRRGDASPRFVDVRILDDALLELDKVFSVELSNATGVEVLRGHAGVRIEDDERRATGKLELFTIDLGTQLEDGTQAVCGAGDIDRDGHDDFVVAEPLSSIRGPGSGAVRIYSGRDARVLRTHTGQPGWHFGVSVAAAGDVNLDGYTDLIVGSQPAGALTATALVLSGKSGQILLSLQSPRGQKGFGCRVATAGDVDKDGRPDLVVADPGGGQSGRVHVFSGRDAMLLATIDGEDRYAGTGSSLASLGDLDADGHADLAVGAFRGARVYSGKWISTGQGVAEMAALDHAPAVCNAGDLDGDGLADLAVGRSDLVEIVSGSWIGAGVGRRVLVAHPFLEPLVMRSSSMAAVGDLDGDGVPDLLAGPHLLAGGKPGAILYTFAGRKKFDGFGASVARIGDVDRDGRDDFVLANGNSLFPRGYARVYSPGR